MPIYDILLFNGLCQNNFFYLCLCIVYYLFLHHYTFETCFYGIELLNDKNYISAFLVLMTTSWI